MVVERSAPPLFGSGCAAGLVLGALACVQLPVLPPLWLCMPLAIASATGWIVPWRGRAWAAALFGLSWAALHGHWVLQDQLPPGGPAQGVQVLGRVVDLPHSGPGYTRFVLKVDEADALPSLRGKRLQITWNDPWRGPPASGTDGGRHAVQAGAHWELSLRVRAPRSRINPGGFDGERHALLRVYPAPVRCAIRRVRVSGDPRTACRPGASAAVLPSPPRLPILPLASYRRWHWAIPAACPIPTGNTCALWA